MEVYTMTKCRICGFEGSEGLIMCGDCYRRLVKGESSSYDGLAVRGDNS